MLAMLASPIVFALLAAEDPASLPLLEAGKPLQGNICESDPVIETEILRKQYAAAPVRGRSYRIEFAAGGAYHLDLRSAFFDAYVVVRAMDGRVVAEVDGGGILTDARLRKS